MTICHSRVIGFFAVVQISACRPAFHSSAVQLDKHCLLPETLLSVIVTLGSATARITTCLSLLFTLRFAVARVAWCISLPWFGPKLSMDNPTISLDSLYSLLIDASFEKLDVAQLDDFRKILVALLEEFSTQCKDNHLPTKKLDLLRTALNLLDLTAKSQNSTSGVLIESTSRDPASIPTPATSLHGKLSS